ncbi:MAG: hypothetical protein I8H81_09850 [Pseudomonadales bacterium]|nr:hypothetical protein [Pseudomonadales bacterium]MBH2035460.1 hypothetical protein [Pseudomonadales bacterium]MBH2077745.1 hypothetical protein [Pseudomonadales bacterium]
MRDLRVIKRIFTVLCKKGWAGEWPLSGVFSGFLKRLRRIFSLGEIQYCQYLSVLRAVISSYLVLGSHNDWHKKHC